MPAIANSNGGERVSGQTSAAGGTGAPNDDTIETSVDPASQYDFVTLDRGSADTVRRIRWARGFTMEECAFALGVTVFDYRAKERGSAAFARSEFEQLLRLLEISAADVARWTNSCSGK